MKKKVLIADDDSEIQELFKIAFDAEGYEVISAFDGETALKKIKELQPDAVILDITMPKLNGYEVCQKLREEPRTCLLPIIMLTSLSHTKDKITGIMLGADEYICKPFEPLEVVTRVNGLLKRIKDFSVTNPISGLPGIFFIENEIKKKLNQKKKFKVIYLDIDNFKPYNEKYGFERGDDVIRLTSGILKGVLGQFGDPDDVIGHLGSEDFIIVTSSEKAEEMGYKLIEAFDTLVMNLYDEETRRRGYIWATDEQGEIKKYLLICLSIGMIEVDPEKYQHSSQVIEKAREMWKVAKQKERSSFAIE